jgi:hypothetical protein
MVSADGLKLFMVRSTRPCVLYEMLSGQPVFGGTTTAEILSEVLKSDPDWKRLPPSTPEGPPITHRTPVFRE